MSSIYRVNIKASERGSLEAARLQISVGQPYHEGEKFLAAASWAGRNFKHTHVNLCDSLQRHNLAYLGYTPFQAYDKAIKMGDEWLERNAAALFLMGDVKITRWEDWKSDPSWQRFSEQTKSLYRDDVLFKDSVDTCARAFWERKSAQPGIDPESMGAFIEYSRLYILEEVAISFIMTKPDIVEIYPGSFPPPLVYLRDKALLKDLKMTTIGFAKKAPFRSAA